MKLTPKITSLFIVFFLFITCSFAFDKGWVLIMKGNVGGSLTTPHISDEDLAKLTANKLEGLVGFVGGGSAEVGYIFDNETYFHLPKDHWFGGLGLFGTVGVTQGYAGQISGANVNGQQIDIYVNVNYTPVITFGAVLKSYFFKNRLAVGFGIGGKMIADTSPEYEFYSTAPETIQSEVGKIVVDEWMMKNMNPFMFSTQLQAEYNVKILPTMELILGGYLSYDVYTPKYITMPETIMKMLIESSKQAGKEFDPHEPLKSYFINSFNFGLTFGLGFQL